MPDGKPATGVWAGESKLASIGIACRKWVTFHGLAINVATDLSQFRRINPCGFDVNVMTSLQLLAGRPVAVDEMTPILAAEIGAVLGRSFSPLHTTESNSQRPAVPLQSSLLLPPAIAMKVRPFE